MNVLKVAIVGLALISANTPVRADVIADWNNTAMRQRSEVGLANLIFDELCLQVRLQERCAVSPLRDC